VGVDIVDDLERIAGSDDIVGHHVEIIVWYAAVREENDGCRSKRIDHVDDFERVVGGNLPVMVDVLANCIVVPLKYRCDGHGDVPDRHGKSIGNDILEARFADKVWLGRERDRLVLAEAHGPSNRTAHEADR
jgi:hypothetical protein